ncbi:MAG: molybdenum cofactor biosynthesis protein B [Myxococcales bacterium]|nr:molybdenum cofactor biosynthesis protein B [Myxococcales bacterium]
MVRRPVNIAVLTVSDTRTLENDTSGALLVERLTSAGHRLVDRRLLRDDVAGIRWQLERWIADESVEVVLITGGTGLTGRDVTADVVDALAEKHIPGFGELFRWLSFAEIGTSTMQSRATACLVRRTLLFALPGSTGACRTAWDQILVEQLNIDHRPCNLVELMSRFEEGPPRAEESPSKELAT